MAYNTQSRAFSLSTLAANGAYTIWEHQWTCFYTHLMPFVHNAVPYLLAYNSQTGAAAYCIVSGQENAPQIVWSGVWAAGFTTFMPFQFRGAPHFPTYNSNTGMAQIDCVSSNLEGCYTRFQANWATGFTTFASIVLEGSPGYITYDKTSGTVQFLTIGLQGEVGGSQPGNDLFLTWTANGTGPRLEPHHLRTLGRPSSLLCLRFRHRLSPVRPHQPGRQRSDQPLERLHTRRVSSFRRVHPCLSALRPLL